MKEMNLIDDFLNNRELIKILKYFKHKYFYVDVIIYEEVPALIYILENKIDDITLITRLLNLFNIFNKLDDLGLDYYINILDRLQKTQIDNCLDKDKWYFKNLGLL